MTGTTFPSRHSNCSANFLASKPPAYKNIVKCRARNAVRWHWSNATVDEKEDTEDESSYRSTLQHTFTRKQHFTGRRRSRLLHRILQRSKRLTNVLVNLFESVYRITPHRKHVVQTILLPTRESLLFVCLCHFVTHSTIPSRCDDDVIQRSQLGSNQTATKYNPIIIREAIT